MPKVAKGRRKRSYAPKTTTGCLTCKARRVKCDEARPSCLKCTSAHRFCDGYNIFQALHSPPNKISVIAGPSSEIHASTQALRSFSYFVQRTSPQLAGFFGSEFWERLVLQTAYHEPAVRHAVVAVGSLHETFEHQAMITGADKAFALEEYNLAIRELLISLSPARERRIDVCLITCILFICLENMQGNHASGGSHIRSGGKLLRETVSKSHICSYAPPEVLARIFAVLDSQTTLVVDSNTFKLHEKSLSITTYDDIPLSFSNIEEAKNIFEYGRCLFINNHVSQLSCDFVNLGVAFEAHQAHIKRCVTLLSNFLQALQSFADSKRPFLTQKEDIAMSVLQLHVLGAHVSLHVEQLPPDFPSQWHKVIPQMQQILVLGEKIISSIPSDNDQRVHTTSFCLDMGIIIPLYTVASQCEDPLTRRRAIALLRSTSRQEGLWNSLLAAKAAERIMELEESMLKEENARTSFPSLSRSPSVKPFFELDAKGGRVRYSQRGQDTDSHLHMVEEIFSW